MAYDLEEQEQLATLKAWWKQYGSQLSWVLIAALLSYAAWSGWNYYQRDQSAKGALLYEAVVKATESKDMAKVSRAATDIQDKFSTTPYAQMAALMAAKAAFEASDMALAKTQLQWVIDHGRSDEFKSIARIRLAGLLLDEKAYEAGLKLLAVDFPAQFLGLVADRKGDLLMAQGKPDAARTEYQTALEKTEIKNPARQLIQLKLDALGSAPVKAG